MTGNPPGIPTNLNAVQERVDEVVARAAGDAALHDRLLADPAAAIRGAGVTLPPGVALLVRPSGNDLPHITVEAAPE